MILPQSEGGYGANGGVPGHYSRRRATTTEEDVNDEVRRNRGACVEGWEEIWLVRAVEEALIVAGSADLTVSALVRVTCTVTTVTRMAAVRVTRASS